MATTLSKTTSFVGQASAEIIRKTYFEANSLAEGIFVVKENVQKSWKIRRLNATGIIQDPACDFTPAGTVTIDERSLTPADLEVPVQLCKRDFKNDWFSETMGAGAQGKSMPPAIAQGIIAEIGEVVGEALETMIYQGDTSGTDQFDGVITIADADADVVDVAGTAGGFASNALADMKKIKAAAVTAKIASRTDFIYIMSPTNASALQDAYRTAGSGQENISGDVPLSFNGTPIHVSYGVPDNKILAVRKSNLYFGTDLLSDFNQVSVKDMEETDLSANVRYKLVATGGVNYGWGQELILYTAA